MAPDAVHYLTRRRKTVRSCITKFVGQLNSEGNDDDYTVSRTTETLAELERLDAAIHEQLTDEEYDADVLVCQEYTEKTKRALHEARKKADPTKTSNSDKETTAHSSDTPVSQPRVVKLPTVHLQKFSGNPEEWHSFWERFKSAIDDNELLSVIDKHVFLRGYLDGEAKLLVDGISVITDTYETVKRLLHERYGDINLIIQLHLDFLDSLLPRPNPTTAELNDLFLDCNRRVNALQSLGEDVNNYGRLIVPKILRAFPADFCKRWIVYAKRSEVKETHVTQLMSFISEEIRALLATDRIQGTFTHEYSQPTLPHYPSVTAAFHASPLAHKEERKPKVKRKQTPDPFCVFCDKRGHWGQCCVTVPDVQARIEKLKREKRCFLCLNKFHNATACPRKAKALCSRCKQRNHHVSICERPNAAAETSVGKIQASVPGFSFLQTARVRITGPTGLSRITRCLLDPGSQTTFINSSLIGQLNLKVTGLQQLHVKSFESSPSSCATRAVVSLNVTGTSTSNRVFLDAFETDHVYSVLPTVPVDIADYAFARQLTLADSNDGSHLPIELLIGADFYWQIVKSEKPIALSSTLVLIPSVFGYVLSGTRTNVTVSYASTHHISLLDDHNDVDVRRLWDLDAIGVQDTHSRKLSAVDEHILHDFHEAYHVRENRRVVSLPRKHGLHPSDNFTLTGQRFQSLEKKFEKNADFRSYYHDLMMDYISKEQVEIAPSYPNCDVYYMPHHLVKKVKDGATKWRIVFDASSSAKGHHSLNDTLHMGPNLLPEILAVFLRFRCYEKAVVGDITQAFLQLCLHEKDRDWTRFLWYNVQRNPQHFTTTSEIVPYRFTRVPFGLTCSPFLLTATLRELSGMNAHEYPVASSIVDKNMFMDDCAFSAGDDNTIIAGYYQLTALLRKNSFTLSKWCTNSITLQDLWIAEGQEVKTSTSVLGLNWRTISDEIYLNTDNFSKTENDGLVTKRHTLRQTAKFYDPLGLFSPFVIIGKIIFQDTWFRGLKWDELLPTDLAVRWQSWISSLPLLSAVSVPRWIGLATDTTQTEVHVFCDASERAYGCVLYVRLCTNSNLTVRLVCSKGRLTPVKKITLPRLELLAGLLGARLLHYFCNATGVPVNQATLWSDSTVTLSWIKSEPHRWKTFVCNRVSEIHQYTSPCQWRHCPGKDNPADHLSRGLSADSLLTSDSWWHGPAWLTQPHDSWPQDITLSIPVPDEKRVASTFHVDAPTPVIDSTRFSSYWRLIHTTVYVLRFVRLLQERCKHSFVHFTAKELHDARDFWVKQAQQESFSAEISAIQKGAPLPNSSKIARFNPYLHDGIVRLGGRLQFSALTPTEKHPILLDGSHPFVKLLVMHTHLRLHHLGVSTVLNELRSQFWILRARQIVKKVLHQCLPCKFARQQCGVAIEAPLPSDRTVPLHPFAVVGLDFAGPLYLKSKGQSQKSYILLLTCATTRAVHLELVTDLSTDRFLMAFQRFASRRGLPHTIYSDNAQTFHAANRELTELCKLFDASEAHNHFAHHSITWKFIAPRAAWWGGWWERMIGTTKRCIKKILGHAFVDEEVLNTVLSSVEAAINSRPISQGDNEETLSPAHFLIGRRISTIPRGNMTSHCLVKDFRIKQKLTEDLWSRWKTEYLLQLRSYHEVKQPRRKGPRFRVGDVALLSEDVRPRSMWRRAVITQLHPGRDGNVRTVRLRLTDGSIVARPIQLVIPLEVDQGGEDVEERTLS